MLRPGQAQTGKRLLIYVARASGMPKMGAIFMDEARIPPSHLSLPQSLLVRLRLCMCEAVFLKLVAGLSLATLENLSSPYLASAAKLVEQAPDPSRNSSLWMTSPSCSASQYLLASAPRAQARSAAESDLLVQPTDCGLRSARDRFVAPALRDQSHHFVATKMKSLVGHHWILRSRQALCHRCFVASPPQRSERYYL